MAEKPDIIFVNNDSWIVNQLYAQIKDLHGEGQFKFCAYMPMDSYGWTGVLNDHASSWDSVITYTEFGAKEFHNAGVTKPVTVIPHGITNGQFYEMDKKECRRRLGVPEDCFMFSTVIAIKLVNGLTSLLMVSVSLLLINLTPSSTCTWVLRTRAGM